MNINANQYLKKFFKDKNKVIILIFASTILIITILFIVLRSEQTQKATQAQNLFSDRSPLDSYCTIMNISPSPLKEGITTAVKVQMKHDPQFSIRSCEVRVGDQLTPATIHKEPDSHILLEFSLSTQIKRGDLVIVCHDTKMNTCQVNTQLQIVPQLDKLP